MVAFNRVIAADLRKAIDGQLTAAGVTTRTPTVMTIHALCLKMLGDDVRLLLPHEVEAMLYDVRHAWPALREKYPTFGELDQALRDVEAGHLDDPALAGRRPMAHAARSGTHQPDPEARLARLHGGDDADVRYLHVLVDEFQDLTPTEQALVMRLRDPEGMGVNLGDPRQSIYVSAGTTEWASTASTRSRPRRALKSSTCR